MVLVAIQAYPHRELFLNYPYPPFPLHVGFVSKQALHFGLLCAVGKIKGSAGLVLSSAFANVL